MEKPCKETSRAKDSNGYGRLNSKYWHGHSLHHRYVYAFHYGSIPEGMDVLHHCDNPSCIEITHLFLGTNYDNVQDSIKKGRNSRGEGKNSAKLTEKEVLEIRASEYDFSQLELAEMYKVDQSTIHDILRRNTWRHI